MNTCKKCGLERQEGKRCVPCRQAYQKAYFGTDKGRKYARDKMRGYRKANPEKIRAYEKAYRSKNYDIVRSMGLKYNYGISLEEYNTMVAQQQGVCAICQNPPGKRPLGVDHHHASGKVRQLLCNNCNTIVGLCHEDTFVLTGIISYLDKHK